MCACARLRNSFCRPQIQPCTNAFLCDAAARAPTRSGTSGLRRLTYLHDRSRPWGSQKLVVAKMDRVIVRVHRTALPHSLGCWYTKCGRHESLRKSIRLILQRCRCRCSFSIREHSVCELSAACAVCLPPLFGCAVDVHFVRSQMHYCVLTKSGNRIAPGKGQGPGTAEAGAGGKSERKRGIAKRCCLRCDQPFALPASDEITNSIISVGHGAGSALRL